MLKIKIGQGRREYLAFSIWMKIQEHYDNGPKFKVETTDHQLRVILMGKENKILINFLDDEIQAFKAYHPSDEIESTKLFETICGIIKQSVSEDIVL